MAITRTQIAKQLLAQGGRTGFRIGSDEGDVSGREYGGSSKGSQNTGGSGDGGDRREQYSVARTTTPQELIALPGGERNTGLERARKRNRDLIEKFKSKRPKVNIPNFGLSGMFLNLFNKGVSSPIQRFADFTASKNRPFFENVIRSGKIEGLNFGTVANMTDEELEQEYKNYMSARMNNEIDAYGNPINQDRDGPPILLPQMTAQAPSITEEEEPEYVNPLSKLTPRIAGTQFAAAGGGIASLDDMDREGFVLGGIAKGLKKAVKGIKKLAKSPIGKAALGFAAFQYGKGLFGPKGAGKFLYSPVQGSGSIFSGFPGGKVGAGIVGISALAGAMTPKEDEDKFNIDSYYASNKLDPSQSIRGMGSEFDFYGGERMKVAEGGDVEPVAKKTMPLLDMDGMEKDYREDGGFVPIGRMEKADDVPARLSKNEFVFTADAVRNAGEGDVDKGAEVMYNMMKNLESGGEVSEESQGLEGARKMFQTSQRLEEVL